MAQEASVRVAFDQFLVLKYDEESHSAFPHGINLWTSGLIEYHCIGLVVTTKAKDGVAYAYLAHLGSKGLENTSSEKAQLFVESLKSLKNIAGDIKEVEMVVCEPEPGSKDSSKDVEEASRVNTRELIQAALGDLDIDTETFHRSPFAVVSAKKPKSGPKWSSSTQRDVPLTSLTSWNGSKTMRMFVDGEGTTLESTSPDEGKTWPNPEQSTGGSPIVDMGFLSKEGKKTYTASSPW
eukprot:TRINITY_DN83627_c0_g1_i1.p1 TRINITY_DN83627_c0_g1~~TRINITY_DN83627_c0_g1_i1.p1  ORF type:complete len:237 (+),score=38.19 TRINITY_DN83627_c0_g1_i1:95-805(+)